MKKEFKIEGMSCNHCVMAVKKALSNLGVNKYEVELGKAVVEFDNKKVSETEIVKAIEEEGYKVV